MKTTFILQWNYYYYNNNKTEKDICLNVTQQVLLLYVSSAHLNSAFIWLKIQ